MMLMSKLMQISRKECEKFKMAINFDYDFSGWATKANVKCFDGLTIAPNAFKDCDGKVVPVVWNHDHSAPESVLGHALLQNRKEGVYALCQAERHTSGQTAKACVDNGTLTHVHLRKRHSESRPNRDARYDQGTELGNCWMQPRCSD